VTEPCGSTIEAFRSPLGQSEIDHADVAGRIEMTMTTTMIPVPIAETARMKRLVEFASGVTRLADERADLDLRELADELHSDPLALRGDDDDG
jgi:hypothetical protein